MIRLNPNSLLNLSKNNFLTSLLKGMLIFYTHTLKLLNADCLYDLSK